MKKSGKTKNLGLLARGLFQEILREHVKTVAERQELAKVLGISESAVKGMLYAGTGGLDNWINAFAYYYQINESTFKNLKTFLKKEYAVNESDKVWAAIKTSEAKKLKLALIAKAVCQIEEDLD